MSTATANDDKYGLFKGVKEGTKIQFTATAYVRGVDDCDYSLNLSAHKTESDDSDWFYPDSDPGFKVTKVETIEDYEPGKTYESLIGYKYIRTNDDRWYDITEHDVKPDHYPSRPLKPAVLPVG
jgi:hypothetical protein